MNLSVSYGECENEEYSVQWRQSPDLMKKFEVAYRLENIRDKMFARNVSPCENYLFDINIESSNNSAEVSMKWTAHSNQNWEEYCQSYG